MQEPDFQVSAEPSIFDTIITPDRSSSEYRNTGAFAVLKSDGSVVSWGKNIPDPQDVNSTLANENFRHVYSNAQAFAGIKQDGSVISWGRQKSGGNSSQVANELQAGIQSIASTKRAFTALKEDGFITSWGRADYGGNSIFHSTRSAERSSAFSPPIQPLQRSTVAAGYSHGGIRMAVATALKLHKT